MLVLHIQAAFGAFRALVAGTYRTTAPFITPSAAYGLLLNIAGVESRFDDGVSVMTRTRDGLPAASVAVGMIVRPQVCSLYQQLHSYPPGEGKKIVDPQTGRKVGERELGLARTKRGKWRITPVHRELLCGIDGYVALRGNDELEQQVRDGLAGGVGVKRPDGRPRYGVPFLGDNSYLIDKLRSVDPPERRVPTYWYARLSHLPAEEMPGVRPGTCRMTVWIDRADMSRSLSDLYAPVEIPTTEPPEAAWTRIGPASS